MCVGRATTGDCVATNSGMHRCRIDAVEYVADMPVVSWQVPLHRKLLYNLAGRLPHSSPREVHILGWTRDEPQRPRLVPCST
jgi:hypothetical protein